MTKRKLKKYVKPTILLVSICTITLSLLSLTNISEDVEEKNTHVINTIIEEETPVVNTEVENTNQIIRPYTTDKVSISKSFYEKDGTEEEQINSLIYYENTYLQNNGTVYASSEEFDVISVLNGSIIDIKQDELLNTIVYISHNNSLTTIYYGLKDVNWNVNDAINQGDIIGKSTNNVFCESPNSLLFEVNYNGQVLNPEKFYTMDLNELN